MIPQIIHQFWLGSELPEHLAKCHDSIKKVNPNWDVRLHRTADILDDRAFEHHAELRGFFNMLDGCYRPLPVKCDLLKMLHVYRDGGIAMDIDMYGLRSMDAFINDKIVLGSITSDPQLVSEAVIGAEAGSKDIAWMIKCFLTRKLSSEGIVTANLSGLSRNCLWHVYEPDFFVPHNKSDDDSKRYFYTQNTRTIHLWGNKKYDFRKLVAIAKKVK